MSSIGTGYDLSASQFSSDGRVFHVEYAHKAVENGGTVIGLRRNDGVVFAIEEIVTSTKFFESGANKRIFNIDQHVGMAVSGTISDTRQIAETARSETASYKAQYGVGIPLKYLNERVSLYMHAYTLYSAVRPYSCSILLSAYETSGPALYMIAPSGISYGYYGCAVGKAKQLAKTEIEKLKLSEMTCKDLVEEAALSLARIIYLVHDELKEKQFELEMSWVGAHTSGRRKRVPADIKAEAETKARQAMAEDSDSDTPRLSVFGESSGQSDRLHPRALSNSAMGESNDIIFNWDSLQDYQLTVILSNVFRELDGKTLGIAVKVNRAWSNMANKEKNKRGPYCESINLNSFMDLDANTALLWGVKPIKIRINPAIAFLFIHDGRPKRIDTTGFKRDLLPHHCDIIMLYSRCYIMNNNEIECNRKDINNMVCAFVPKNSNMKINTFSLICSVSFQARISQWCQQIINVISQETCICLILLCNQKGFMLAEYLEKSIENSIKDKIVAIWGGVVQDVHPVRLNESPEEQEISTCVAILITGNIKTWSIILNENCNTKAKVKRRLKFFKEQLELKKQSMGFMFASHKRGLNMYGKPKVEATVFNMLFPKVPLVGCFGYGMFGKDNDKEAPDESWFDSSSTIFLIITYD